MQRIDLIAAGVRFLSETTPLFRRPATFDTLLDDMFAKEPYERRVARNIDESIVQSTELVKKIVAKRKDKTD